MNSSPPALFDRLAGILRFIFWGLLVVALLLTFFSRGTLERERAAALEQVQAARKSRAIALIHRQDRLNFLGIPVASYINIEDSEAVLRAIDRTAVLPRDDDGRVPPSMLIGFRPRDL